MKQLELIQKQETDIKDLKNEISMAELKVQNAELKVDKLQYEFDSYKEEVRKQLKRHKWQKVLWGILGVGAGIAIGHSI